MTAGREASKLTPAIGVEQLLKLAGSVCEVPA